MNSTKIIERSILVLFCFVFLYGCCVERVPFGDANDDACVIDDNEDADVTPCEIPTGEYTGFLRYTSGDCEEISNLDGTLGSMSVGDDVSCGFTWYMLPQHNDDCAYATLYIAYGDDTGLFPNSHVTMTTTCDGGYVCTNTYIVDLEPVSE